MELYEIKKNTFIDTRWAFDQREPRDLNPLEVAGVEVLTCEGLDELFGATSGDYFANNCAAWCGACWCSCFNTQKERDKFTLPGGYAFSFSCVVGLALLLVFHNSKEKERVIRIIL